MTYSEIITAFEIGLIFGIVGIGIFITFRIIDFPDLTCDGSFVLGAASCGILIKNGYNCYFALVISMISGLLAGLTTSILHTKLKINDLLSGILVAFMLYSLNLRVMNNVPNISLINNHTIFSNANVLIILLLIASFLILLLGWFFHTDYGLALRVIGQNKILALINGIKPETMMNIALMLSNLLVALAGGLFSQHQYFADAGSGSGIIVLGLTAVIIGETILKARSFYMKIFACILGSISYRLLVSLALHSEALRIESQDLNLITGCLIIFLISVQKTYVKFKQY